MELQGKGWSYREKGGATEEGVELQGKGWSYRGRGGATEEGVDQFLSSH